ncbi:MAG: S-layer homology domain-containing protein, partial [Clostridia bacterium]|nr:S-layer homology domain-containing protein [Clostridia bacterium]
MIATKGGAAVTLSDQTWTKGGVLYVPADLFKTGLNMEVTIDIDARRAYFNPGVYKIYLTEENAAMTDLADPEKDLLSLGASATDNIIYNESILSKVEKSLYYKFDLGQFAGKSITNAKIFAYCGVYNNLNPTLGAIRTEPWEKGMTYSTAPKHYEGATIVKDSRSFDHASHGQGGKYYILHSVNVTSWANDALFKGEQLSVKLLGIPQTKTSSTPQLMVKGVKTSQKAYLSVTVDELFNFPVAQAEKETDIDRNTFEKLGFLTKLGVFKEGEEFPADLTTGVTRREFISYAIRLMNDFEYDENAAQIFADVAPKSAAYGEIMECAALGLISSGEGMEFRPDDIITYDEALTVIGRMLGYGTYAERNGGFSVGYVSAALKSDLLKGVRSHSGKIGFDSMFNLFFNALESPMFETSVYYASGGEEYIFKSDTTLLSVYWNLKKVEGTMQGNEYTNLNPDIPGTRGKVIIDGKKYNISNSDYNFLLGYKVKGYYDKDDNLLYLGAEENKNDSEVIDLHSVINVTKSGAINFTYKDTNGKNNTESIQSTDKIIYNGKSIKFSQLTTKLLDKDTGSITYLNDDIVIITAYTTVVVYNVDEEKEVISDKYLPYDNTLRLKGTDYYTFRDENGNSIALDKLAADDVISAAVSLDKKLVVGEVSKTKLTGKITAITDENEIEVNGNLYETVGENLSWIKDIEKLGTQGTLLLDVFGFVAGFEAARPTDNIFGYVLTAGTGGSVIKPQLQLGLITTEAEKMVVYNLAEKVVIDGVSCKTHDAILKALGDTDGIGSSTDVKKQGIVFSVNQDREIIKIDTPEFKSNEIEENSLHSRYTSSKDALHYKSGAGRLGDLFYWNRSTALNVMFTGDKTKPEQVNDPEYYQYFKSGLSSDKKYNMDVYSVGKKHPNADIIFVSATPSTSVSGTIAIAGKRVFAINDDGDYDEKLYYYVASTTASSAIISSDFASKASSSSKTDLAALKPGDIIRIGKDFNGNLTAIKRYYAYDAENPQIISNPDYSKESSSEGSNYFNYQYRIYGGYITTKYNSYVRFIDDIDKINTEETYKNATDDMFRWVNLNMNSGDKKVFKYEVEGSDVIVSKATADDVVDYDHVPYAPSGIMLQTTYAQQIDAAYIINVKQPDNTGIYKITFEPGENASGTKDFIRANLNDTVTLPSSAGFLNNDPAYAFDCWIYNGQNYAEGDIVTVTGDMVFTAKWKWVGVQYDITYDGNGADSGSVAADRAIGGSTYTVAPNPEDTGFKKTNYYFAGWEYNGVTYQPGDTITMPEEPVTFKAKWEQPAGAGTVADPYQITNATELKWFANYVNAGNTTACATLMNDIDLNSENWYNYRIKNFAGTFDGGNGKAIKNFYVADSNSTDQGGLFRSINGGTLKSLVFENAKAVSNYTTNATSATYTSIVCGELIDGTIQDIKVSGSITVETGKHANTAGSIVAYMKKGTVKNCISDVTIDLSLSSGSNDNTNNNAYYGVGGIVGLLDGTTAMTISECGFKGTINAPYNSRVAGIIGSLRSNNGNLRIEKCYNTGNITGLRQVAGILGWANTGTYQKENIILHNYNTGDIIAKSATNSYASG